MGGFKRLGQFSLIIHAICGQSSEASENVSSRQRININSDWRFWRSEANPDGVIYDHRHDINVDNALVLKPWILPSGNNFIANPADRHERPKADPGGNISYVLSEFDDDDWEPVRLPHDRAVRGPFYREPDPIVGGGMGRLPVHGVGWYRRKLSLEPGDEGKTVYLDIDGAMSYAIVWLNGHLVGGWPYGYNSFRLDLTPYLDPEKDNQLAIRLDNPLDSARWYPGGGLYRSVWLIKVAPVHVGQWGVENTGHRALKVDVSTDLYALDGGEKGEKVSRFPKSSVKVDKGEETAIKGTTKLNNPQLWGPSPLQEPNLYIATTTVRIQGRVIDTYDTRFGVRTFVSDPVEGFSVNGERITIQGVNQHHDLGALGAAFNVRAAECQLEVLQELGVNAIRMAHNPPASELLGLTDRMGFLVMDEIFDSWERNKTDWHETDLRAFHASIFSWSFGNEVGEQYAEEAGAVLGRRLHVVREEDPTRPSTASMNYAKPDMPFGNSMDFLSINYQGSGIRDTPNYSHLQGIRTHPLYPDFHSSFPDKMIIGSETASALSTRGTYLFPIVDVNTGAPINATSGGDATTRAVSAYELYTANFGSPLDKVWVHQDRNPFVAGEFVWTGWDYVGEPTPYYSARSSYCGIVDLAGFKKDRFFLYQSRWRPLLPMAYILPHWKWPDRVGEVTPVHVLSSANEAELFINGKSQGKKKRDAFEYRFRWDGVVHDPGEVSVVAYKDGKVWADATRRTTGEAAGLRLTVDREIIDGDGVDLAFITVEVVDDQGNLVPDADDLVNFSIVGPGIIVTTDNGNPADMVEFPSQKRQAFSGLALAIVQGTGRLGDIIVTVEAEGLSAGEIRIMQK